MTDQTLLSVRENCIELAQYFSQKSIRRILLVCGKSYDGLSIKGNIDSICSSLGIEIVYFRDFVPNPKYESVEAGVRVFNDNNCDAILAVGGGSAMDVAKCIKLFCNMDHSINYLSQDIIPNDIPFIAVPTTSGTGSEATRFAVIYYQGNKQSVTHISCIPQVVLFDATLLKSLPLYQKKVTMLDALCHAVESMWSVNSTEESLVYSKQAIELIKANMKNYLEGEEQALANMLHASYLAGKAINITQTTAGHAMCYKITSLFGVSHGHAAFMCILSLLPYMLNNMDRCIDSRGKQHLESIFVLLCSAFECASTAELVDLLKDMYNELDLDIPTATKEQFEILKNSVNPDRLKNNPVALDVETIDYLYHQILKS